MFGGILSLIEYKHQSKIVFCCQARADLNPTSGLARSQSPSMEEPDAKRACINEKWTALKVAAAMQTAGDAVATAFKEALSAFLSSRTGRAGAGRDVYHCADIWNSQQKENAGRNVCVAADTASDARSGSAAASRQSDRQDAALLPSV